MLNRQESLEAQNALRQLYRNWHHDRALQHLVPLRHCWRGCLGLALMVECFDNHAIAHCDQTFLPNHALTWLALRDLPPGQCRNDRTMDFRGACLASTTQARLSYGLPTIDFTRIIRDDWDMKRRPIHSGLDGPPARPDVLDARHYGRKWAVLNRLSAAMTNFAFNAQDDRGQSIRRPWCIRRPSRSQPSPLVPVASWFPNAYLAFQPTAIRRLHLPRQTGKSHSIFTQPIVTLNSNMALVPASRLGRHKQPVDPSGLWWDLTPSAAYLDADLEAFVFPPLFLLAFNRLCRELPGNVQLQMPFETLHNMSVAKHFPSGFDCTPKTRKRLPMRTVGDQMKAA